MKDEKKENEEKLDVEKYFARIKENHKIALQNHMQVRFQKLGLTDEKSIGHIQDAIKEKGVFFNLHNEATNYLNGIFNTPSFLDKVGAGALAVLAGGIAGGAATVVPYLATNFLTAPITYLKHLFMPYTPDVNISGEVVKAGLGVGLGALVTYALYKSMTNRDTGIQSEEFKNFQQEISNTDYSVKIQKECNVLAAELIKLFHFREMLLCGKMSHDSDEPGVRQELLKQLSGKLDNKNINVAIEAYFLEQMQGLFNHAFEQIYEVHEQDINEDIQNHDSWLFKLKQYFSNKEKVKKDRETTTQEIQLEFMTRCRDFLVAQMNEPRMLAKYPRLTATVGGIAAGVIVFSVLMATGPVGWAAAGVVLASIAVTIVTNIFIKYLLTHVDALKYKRNASNREGIKEAIVQIESETKLLQSRIIGGPKETHEKDVQLVHQFAEKNKKRFVLDAFKQKPEFGMGLASAWMREYAARYRHSKLLQNELSNEINLMIKNGQNQTESIIQELKNGKTTEILKKFTVDSTKYLTGKEKDEGKQKEKDDFIHNFDLINKLKEQAIHIAVAVGVVPNELEDFYKNILGGSEADLQHAINMRPKDENNNYKTIRTAAYKLEKAIDKFNKNSPIFIGDTVMRNDLNMGNTDKLELNLHADNIEAYLSNSLEFLLTLNSKIDEGKGLKPLNEPSVISPEFTLYRMMLLKQLASFVDVNNHSVDIDIKEKIKSFAKKHLGVKNPDVMFDDVMNQAYLREELPKKDVVFQKDDGSEVKKTGLENVLDAIYLDIAHHSEPMTPRKILDFFIERSLDNGSNKNNKAIFAYGDVFDNRTKISIKDIYSYIENTNVFLNQYKQHTALESSGILPCYEHAVATHVYLSMLQIALNLKTETDEDTINELLNAFEKLDQFAQERQYKLDGEYLTYIEQVRKFTGVANDKELSLEDMQNALSSLSQIKYDEIKINVEKPKFVVEKNPQPEKNKTFLRQRSNQPESESKPSKFSIFNNMKEQNEISKKPTPKKNSQNFDDDNERNTMN